MQLQCLIDKNKGNNYAAARLKGGTVLVGHPRQAGHAEKDLIKQDGKRKIVDPYSEREPRSRTCAPLTKDVNVSYSVHWNGVDRDASNDVMKKAIKDLFDSP